MGRKKNKTNADKIRAMTDEELADYLDCVRNEGCKHCCKCDNCEDNECQDEILSWLQLEVNEGKTIFEAGKGVVTNGFETYRIGFINDEGREDETEYSVYNLKELVELYAEFCRENGFKTNTVTYIERA